MKSTNNKGAVKMTTTKITSLTDEEGPMMTAEQSHQMKWTKISDGCYRLNGTDYEAVKDQHADGTRWSVYYGGLRQCIPSEPSREFAGYAIQALIAEQSR